ncbi:DUF4129 domain-containing protein [Streptomyces sp. NPDC096080]|uniref:DUF4129 domain-containing protein n=1 Tax=Streptomyces sp. NPDC096080 TaxID=3156693 RepID=UPI00331C253B
MALEQDLVRVRIPREPFETPTELLDRAARGGLPISQARRPAQLFAEARYSSRPVTDGQREQAERSLAAVRRQWARQRPAAPASPPGGEGA